MRWKQNDAGVISNVPEDASVMKTLQLMNKHVLLNTNNVRQKAIYGAWMAYHEILAKKLLGKTNPLVGIKY